MTGSVSRGITFLVLLSVTLAGSTGLHAATAEPEREARRHLRTADARFRAGLFAEALAEYQAGYRSMPLPGFLVNTAQCYRRLGDLPMARLAYQKFTVAAPTSPLVPEIQKLIAELDQRIADLESARSHDAASPAASPKKAAPPDDPDVFVDAPLFLSIDDPVVDAQRAPVVVAPAPEPAPASRTRAWLWLTVGLLAVGGTVAAIALSSEDTTTVHDGSLGTLRR